ncbi:phosphate propanoyltransferase [Candidatus Atribacteria bacterium RBG_19FT_COMBO_35_14]|uniref:Phosphate propanoyltransferase n=1 Tax=Candidatus Sediminicultor quintus TaxID=1797291 RepID=A0A1F5AB11_9BACT|nr:MAG: phosphate propanoyltransferase [Candidatus Atribacteria bacterium RBG_19FT_COMBO_35_14]
MEEKDYKKLVDMITETIYREIKPKDEPSNLFSIPVEISNHHVHLTRGSLDILYGKDYELTKLRDLSQPGEFASNEQVSIVSANMKFIEKVRILGPLREYTQAELSITDGYFLGLDLPTRISGNLKGSPPIIFMGPQGVLTLSEGAIRAARHIHMTPENAESYQVKNGDRVKVEVSGDHGVIYKDVVIRVSQKSKLALHLDTDEANAGNVENKCLARIIKKFFH